MTTPKAQREADYWKERCASIITDMRDAIGSGYPAQPVTNDKCSHGKFGWEDCIACYDEFLTARLDRFVRNNIRPEGGEE